MAAAVVMLGIVGYGAGRPAGRAGDPTYFIHAGQRYLATRSWCLRTHPSWHTTSWYDGQFFFDIAQAPLLSGKAFSRDQIHERPRGQRRLTAIKGSCFRSSAGWRPRRRPRPAAVGASADQRSCRSSGPPSYSRDSSGLAGAPPGWLSRFPPLSGFWLECSTTSPTLSPRRSSSPRPSGGSRRGPSRRGGSDSLPARPGAIRSPGRSHRRGRLTRRRRRGLVWLFALGSTCPLAAGTPACPRRKPDRGHAQALPCSSPGSNRRKGVMWCARMASEPRTGRSCSWPSCSRAVSSSPCGRSSGCGATGRDRPLARENLLPHRCARNGVAYFVPYIGSVAQHSLLLALCGSRRWLAGLGPCDRRHLCPEVSAQLHRCLMPRLFPYLTSPLTAIVGSLEPTPPATPAQAQATQLAGSIPDAGMEARVNAALSKPQAHRDRPHDEVKPCRARCACSRGWTKLGPRPLPALALAAAAGGTASDAQPASALAQARRLRRTMTAFEPASSEMPYLLLARDGRNREARQRRGYGGICPTRGAGPSLWSRRSAQWSSSPVITASEIEENSKASTAALHLGYELSNPRDPWGLGPERVQLRTRAVPRRRTFLSAAIASLG